MMFRILALLLLPVICLAQVNSNGEKPTGELLTNEISPNEMKRNASFNLDEIKVRWKKAALENCTGVPCVVTPPPPPPPSFTCGTSTVTDVDGNSYNTVSIGTGATTQCWTASNLKVSRYNNSSPIDLDASGTANGFFTEYWSTRISGAYTIYANESITLTNGNASNYGYLYNWYAVNDSRKLCPDGWHVPTDAEWATLETYLNTVAPTGSVGDKMKSKGDNLLGTGLWNSPNMGNNSSGFSALPGGYRSSTDGTFYDVSNKAFFWSGTEAFGVNAWYRSLDFNMGDVDMPDDDSKKTGLSVRCLRD
jgi:uncharacterized protein (TIGR02145 family)